LKTFILFQKNLLKKTVVTMENIIWENVGATVYITDRDVNIGTNVLKIKTAETRVAVLTFKLRQLRESNVTAKADGLVRHVLKVST